MRAQNVRGQGEKPQHGVEKVTRSLVSELLLCAYSIHKCTLFTVDHCTLGRNEKKKAKDLKSLAYTHLYMYVITYMFSNVNIETLKYLLMTPMKSDNKHKSYLRVLFCFKL